jgi:hypothetical protein
VAAAARCGREGAVQTRARPRDEGEAAVTHPHPPQIVSTVLQLLKYAVSLQGFSYLAVLHSKLCSVPL